MYGVKLNFWEPIADPERDKAALAAAQAEIDAKAELVRQWDQDRARACSVNREGALSQADKDAKNAEIDALIKPEVEQMRLHAASMVPGAQKVLLVNVPTDAKP